MASERYYKVDENYFISSVWIPEGVAESKHSLYPASLFKTFEEARYFAIERLTARLCAVKFEKYKLGCQLQDLKATLKS